MRTRTSGGVGGAGVSPAPTQSHAIGTAPQGGFGSNSGAGIATAPATIGVAAVLIRPPRLRRTACSRATLPHCGPPATTEALIPELLSLYHDWFRVQRVV
jgi:hypothetical protein